MQAPEPMAVVHNTVVCSNQLMYTLMWLRKSIKGRRMRGLTKLFWSSCESSTYWSWRIS